MPAPDKRLLFVIPQRSGGICDCFLAVLAKPKKTRRLDLAEKDSGYFAFVEGGPLWCDQF
jgi:hypothetical protein